MNINKKGEKTQVRKCYGNQCNLLRMQTDIKINSYKGWMLFYYFSFSSMMYPTRIYLFIQGIFFTQTRYLPLYKYRHKFLCVVFQGWYRYGLCALIISWLYFVLCGKGHKLTLNGVLTLGRNIFSLLYIFFKNIKFISVSARLAHSLSLLYIQFFIKFNSFGKH